MLWSLWIWKQSESDQRPAEEKLPLSCVISRTCDLFFQSLLASADPKSCFGFAFKASSPTPRWVLEPFSLHIPLHRHTLAWLLLSAPFKCVPFQPWDLQTPLSHTKEQPSVKREGSGNCCPAEICLPSTSELAAFTPHFTSEPEASSCLQSLRREQVSLI